MKAKETRLDTLMTIANQQFIAPIFQRKYSWKEKQCEKLWDDVIRIGSNDNPEAGHFIGSLVCYQQSISLPGKVTDLMIIDGQQRLTTMSLIMLAIAREYKKIGDELAYKTTIANKLSKHFNDNKIDHTLLSIDYLYLDFIKEFFPYLYGIEINNNIKPHYERLENNIGKDFYYYIKKKIREGKGHIIIDGRHLELMGNKIKKEFMKEFEIHEIIMDKEKPLIQIGLSVHRDMDFYKVILYKIFMQ